MKKKLLFGMICMAAGVSAVNASDPVLLPEFYAQKISQDGNWIMGESPNWDVMIYNAEVGVDGMTTFPGARFGNGNSITVDGTAVGSDQNEQGIIMKGDEAVTPASMSKYGFSSFYGITNDGMRICGIVNGDPEGGMMYKPMYIEKGEDGEYGEPVILPYPEKDFFGDVPQFVSAVWISNDGKTIMGQVVDYSGLYVYPIVYRQDADGEWSYTLPTESLFNPNDLEIPENPGEFDESKEVKLTDFMSDEQRAKYEEAFQAWVDSGYQSDMKPEYADYMTEEELAAYEAAMAEYEAYVAEFNEKSDAYYIARDEIIASSTPFLLNGFAMDSDGTLAACASEKMVDTGDWMPVYSYQTCVLNLVEGGDIKMIESENKDIVPGQVLDGGVIVGSTPIMGTTPPTSYIFVPGAADYVPLEEYMNTVDSDAAAWMNDNLLQNVVVDYDMGTWEPIYKEMLVSGLAMASDDLSVVAGAIMPAAAEFDNELNQYAYLTYVFTGMSSGVKDIVANNSVVKIMRDGVISISGEVSNLAVVDLSGRTVFGLRNAGGVIDTNLKRGIYIVTYTDAQGQSVSEKVNF